MKRGGTFPLDLGAHGFCAMEGHALASPRRFRDGACACRRFDYLGLGKGHPWTWQQDLSQKLPVLPKEFQSPTFRCRRAFPRSRRLPSLRFFVLSAVSNRRKSHRCKGRKETKHPSRLEAAIQQTDICATSAHARRKRPLVFDRAVLRDRAKAAARLHADSRAAEDYSRPRGPASKRPARELGLPVIIEGETPPEGPAEQARRHARIREHRSQHDPSKDGDELVEEHHRALRRGAANSGSERRSYAGWRHHRHRRRHPHQDWRRKTNAGIRPCCAGPTCSAPWLAYWQNKPS